MWCPNECRVNGETYKFPLPECSQEMSYIRSEGLVYQAQAIRQALLEGINVNFFTHLLFGDT
jgi:hypothetical protein